MNLARTRITNCVSSVGGETYDFTTNKVDLVHKDRQSTSYQ